ncbi:MAG: hypothetical protein ACI8UD_002444, partial [Planctomycetota bacterium]
VDWLSRFVGRARAGYDELITVSAAVMSHVATRSRIAEKLCCACLPIATV